MRLTHFAYYGNNLSKYAGIELTLELAFASGRQRNKTEIYYRN